MRRHSDLSPERETPLRLALIGAGAMGLNHARVISQSGRVELTAVVDPDLRRAEAAAAFGDASISTSMDSAPLCDAAVIAAPTPAHEAIAVALLGAGIPVLVEKPITADRVSTDRVIAASINQDVPLMCGFVERFNPAITTAGELLDGDLLHLLALRHSPFTPSASSSVVWDLLIHDIDIALQLFDSSAPMRVSSTTWAPEPDAEPEIAECLMTFASGGLATLSSSRAGQRKVRQLLLHTATSQIEVDLLRQDVTVYRHVRHEQVTGTPLQYRSETVVDIPFVRHAGEPLALQLHHFVDLVRGRVDADAERRRLVGPHTVASSVVDAAGRAGSSE